MDIKLSEAFSKPIKEQDAPAKLGLFFGGNILLMALYFGAYILMMVVEGSVNRSAASMLNLLFCCVYIIYIVGVALFNNWHNYEYTSAGLEQRESKALWKYSWGENFKRAAKYTIAQVIYYIPIVVLYFCCAFGVGVLLAGTISTSVMSSYSGYGYGGVDEYALSRMFSTMGVAFLIICCLALIFAVLVYIYHMYIVTPALTYMVKNHTFGDAFKFGKAREAIRKQPRHWLNFVLVQVAIIMTFGILATIFYFLSLLLIGIPLLLALGALSMYYTNIAYPLMLGDNYGRMLK